MFYLHIINSLARNSLAAALGVVRGGAPWRETAWIERSKNNFFLKNIEWAFWKS